MEGEWSDVHTLRTIILCQGVALVVAVVVLMVVVGGGGGLSLEIPPPNPLQTHPSLLPCREHSIHHSARPVLVFYYHKGLTPSFWSHGAHKGRGWGVGGGVGGSLITQVPANTHIRSFPTPPPPQPSTALRIYRYTQVCQCRDFNH